MQKAWDSQDRNSGTTDGYDHGESIPELPAAQTEPHVAPEVASARQAVDALIGRYILRDVNALERGDEQVATAREDGSPVKIMRVATSSKSQAADMRREIAILSRVDDAGICQMHEWLEADDAIWLVIDHIPGNTLEQHVRSHGSLPGSQTKMMLTQLLSGIAYLFANRIAPVRLSAQTLSVDGHSNLIISDLSCAVEYCQEGEVQVEALVTGRYGSDLYTAPESYESSPYNARKAVIWSCGVVLYLMTTGGLDRLNNLDHPGRDRALTHQRRFSVSSAAAAAHVITYPNRLTVPEYARQIIPKMLEVDPGKRAELIEVVARVPKQDASKEARPLMELAWVDYKAHVGPGGTSDIFQHMHPSYSSSVYSDTTLTGLMGPRDQFRSTGW